VQRFYGGGCVWSDKWATAVVALVVMCGITAEEPAMSEKQKLYPRKCNFTSATNRNRAFQVSNLK